MTNEEIKLKIDEYMNRYVKTWAFSGAIMVIKEGEVVFKDGYGLANIEHNIPNTTETKFRLWSITKQFTAVAILMLEERGLISVNDSIRKYFPEYPEFDERITVHHLLTHTAGFFNYADIPYSHKKFYKLPYTSEELIGSFKDKPLDFEPGEGWNYSNSGYYLLGLIIERVSGKKYSQFLKENIFEPLAMRNTGVDDNKTLIQNSASGYYLNGDNLIHCEYIDMNTVFSSGGIYSTVEDMYLWDQALHNGKLINEASLEKMETPYKNDYGYGVNIDEKYNRKRVNHGGGCEGFLNELHRYTDDKVSIVVLSNYGFTAVWKISEVLAAIVFGQKYELPKRPEIFNLDPKVYESYMGVYEEPDIKLTVARDKEKMFFTIDDEYMLPFYPISETIFHHTWIDEQYEFGRNDNGKITLWGIEKSN